ncbi:MAG: FtsX-like permease family protein [Deltaproteobacteria bacterium]
MNAFTIGARSIGRNKRRTAATVGAMAFAGFFCIFYGALIEGMVKALERNALRMELGALQIHHPGYREDPDLYKRIEDTDAIVAALDAKGYGVSARWFGGGLVAGKTTSSGAQLRGIDPEREAGVTVVGSHVKDGAWISAEAPQGVVLGKRLAKTLRLGVGDEVVVLSSAADGSMANALYTVRGVLGPINEAVDRGGVFMTREAFLELFVLDGGAHEIAVALPDGVTLEAAKATVAEVAGGEETLTWKELQPTLADMLEMSAAGQFIMMIVVYLAIAMVVLNAMLMSVFERIREFGVMKALGVTPRQVATVVFVEATAQAMVASVIAVLVAWPVSKYFQTNGIDLTAFVQDVSVMGVAMDPVWYASPTVSNLVVSVVVLIIVTLVSALYPGVKAAIIRPVEAIHHR